jgi:hypothetical protein
VSKGCRAYYHYYHCSGGCKCRFNAETVNGVFQQAINKLVIREGYEPFYEEVLRKAFRLKASNGDYSRKNILQEIRELNGKIERARDLLLSGEFTGIDLQAVKRECENRITVLESRLPDLAFAVKNVDEMVTRCITNSKQLITSYHSEDIERRRAIISSLYPENMVFDGFEVRTTRRNEVMDTILLINNKLGVRKNWTSDGLFHLSSRVQATVQISNYFLADLRLIADLDL